MLNIFALASNDQSISYLAQIFGMVGGAIPSQTTGGSVNLLLPVMFKVLNTIALTVGAIVITYVTFVGLMYTASEGSFLGQKWNKVWVPLRLVIGTISLFPAASGYSLLQVILMWIIVQGVGAADTMWTAILNYAQYSSIFGTVNTTPNTDAGQISVPTTMESLFQGLSCQAAARRTDTSVGNVSYYCNNNSSGFCAQGYELYNVIDGPQTITVQDGIKYQMGPNGACGSLTYCNKSIVCAAPPPPQGKTCDDDPYKNDPQCKLKKGTSSLDCMTCTGQQQALQSIVPVLGSVAEAFAEIDYEYIYFYNNYDPTAFPPSPYKPQPWILDYCSANNTPKEQCCMNGNGCNTSIFYPYGDANNNNPSDDAVKNIYAPYGMKEYLGSSLDFMNAANNQYTQQAITGPTASWVAGQSASALSGWYSDAQKNGWALAGSYYFKLAKASQQNTDAAVPSPFTVDMTLSGSMTNANMRNNFSAAKTLVDTIQTTTLPSTGLGPISPVAGAVTSGMGVVTGAFMNMLTNMANDPMTSLAQFGYTMLVVVQVIFVIALILIYEITTVMSINVMWMGTGMTMSPWGEGIKAVWGVLEPVIIGLLAALFTMGAMLGIYVPLIPYMIFAMSVIGWMIATIEAMVAAPIVALGILGPGGQHEILGRAEPAMLIVLNLFLRPSLMVFGLLTGMLLCFVAVKMVNLGFATISSDMYVYGPVEFLIFMAAYVSFIITVVSKSFSLIHMIPERVLTYIGGPAIQYGEAEALGHVKGAVEGAAGGMAGAGKASGAAMGKIQEGKEKAEYAKKAKEAGTTAAASAGGAEGGAGAGVPERKPPKTPET